LQKQDMVLVKICLLDQQNMYIIPYRIWTVVLNNVKNKTVKKVEQSHKMIVC